MVLPFANGPADGPPDLQVTAGLPPQVCVRLRAGGVRKTSGARLQAPAKAEARGLKPEAYLLRIQLDDQLLLHGQIDLLARRHRHAATADRSRIEREPGRN